MSEASCGPTYTFHPGRESSSSPLITATYPGIMILLCEILFSIPDFFTNLPTISPENFSADHALNTDSPSASVIIRCPENPAPSISVDTIK